MNVIDIIESRKQKMGLSDEEISRRTGGMVMGISYSRHRAGTADPLYKSVVALLDAVDYKLVVVDKNMKGNANIDKWAMILMWSSLYKDDTWLLFKNATGIEPTHGLLDIRKISLFSVWFYRQNKVLPSELMMQEIGRTKVAVTNELETWGLISYGKPSETAYEFYNLVVNAMDDFIRNANVAYEL